MQKVHLLDYLGYVVYRAKVPEPLTRTIVWGTNVYIAGRPAGDGTPRYYLTTVYICPDTNPSGVWSRAELGLDELEDDDEDDDAPKAVKFPGSDTFKRSEILERLTEDELEAEDETP